MSVLGLKIAPLPATVISEHFTNADLQELYRLFCLGNSLPNPSDIANLMEFVYQYDSYQDLAIDNQQMIRDGLGPVFARAFAIKKRKTSL